MTIAQADSYRPVSDNALIELHVRDVGTRAVLLGPYSRFGWYHPGPALYYVLALPYRLSGATVVGLPIAAITVNVAAIAASGYVAFRRGGLVLASLVLLGATVLVGGLGAQAVRDPWNPHVTVLPFLLVVLLAWAVVDGDLWAFPVLVAVGSFVVQAHVGYLGVVGVLVLGALGSVVVAARRGRRTVPVLLAAAAVAGVLWCLPVIEQVTTDPGNLGLVLKFAREGEGPAHPLGDGWHVVSDALGWRFAWAAGLPEPNLFTGSVPLDGGAPVPLGLVALCAATAVAAWRRAYSAVRLDVTVLVALAGAVVSVSRISGEIFPYLVTWVACLAMLAWIAAAWSLWRALPASGRTRLRGPAAMAVGAGLVVAAAAASFDAVNVDVRDRVETEATRQLWGPARAALGGGDHPVLVDALGGFRPQGVAAALVLHLEREGIPVEVPRPISHPYGKRRRSDGGPTRAALLVSPRALLGELRDPSRWELVARWDSARSTTLFLAGDDHLGLYRRRAPARSPAGPLAEPE